MSDCLQRNDRCLRIMCEPLSRRWLSYVSRTTQHAQHAHTVLPQVRLLCNHAYRNLT